MMWFITAKPNVHIRSSAEPIAARADMPMVAPSTAAQTNIRTTLTKPLRKQSVAEKWACEFPYGPVSRP